MAGGKGNAVYKQFEKISDLLTKLKDAGSYEQMFQQAQKFLHAFIPHDAFVGAIVNEKEKKIEFEYVVNVKEGKIYRRDTIPFEEHSTLTGWVAANKRSLHIKDTSDKKNLPANLKLVGEPMRSWLGAPIIYESDVLGVISVQAAEPNKFTSTDIYFLGFIANLLSPIIKSRKLEDDLSRAKKMEMLIEHVLSPVIVIQDKKVVFMNSQVEKFTGMKKDELLGREFLSIVHPDDAKKVMENYEKRLRGVYVPPEYVIKFIDKDGKIRWGFVRAKRIKWNGRWADAVSIADITELKNYMDSLSALEKYLRKLREVDDEAKLYDLVVDAVQNILGIKSVAIGVLEGEHIQIIKSVGCDVRLNFSEHREIMKKAIKKGEIQTVKISDENAYFVPVSLEKKAYGILCVMKKGEIKQQESLISILTNHLALSIQTIRLRRRIEESRDIHKLMVQIVGHDLQNTLAVIKGYAELLKDEYDPEYLGEIFKAIEKAEYIISYAKLFSKLDVYRMKEKVGWLSVREVVERASELVKKRFENARINIKGDAQILGYILLENAFINLFDNAFKYGASRVDITIQTEDDKVKIKVMDDGMGIPENKRDIVFEEFRQLDTSVMGWGLGLWIVKKIVEMHNGSIHIESNKPRGSIFVIEIPKR